jgi:hypothetical protein
MVNERVLAEYYATIDNLVFDEDAPLRDEFEIDATYEERLRNKISAFAGETKTKKTLFLTMVSTYGVKRNKHSSIVRAQVTMDDLFAPPRR